MKNSKTALVVIAPLILAIGFLLFQQINRKSQTMPIPGGNTEGEQEQLREAYIKISHRAAPGVDWRAIEQKNASDAYFNLLHKKYKTGYMPGTWYERGNSNLAGHADRCAYHAATNTLYMMSCGGTIWRTPLPTPSWTLVSDQAAFDNQVIEVAKRANNGHRLFATTNKQIWYTDDDGGSFQIATLTYPNTWSGNRVYKIIAADDGLYTVYAAIDGQVNGNETACLYMSTDTGKSFSVIKKFIGYTPTQLSFSRNYNDGTVYMLGVKNTASDTLYQVYRGSVQKVSTTSTFPSAHNDVKFFSTKAGSTTHCFAFTGGANLYHSTDLGKHWYLKHSFVDTTVWNLGVTLDNPQKVFYGNVEAWRSSDTGTHFTRINYWTEYYGDPTHKLHADIDNIYFSRYSNGTEFGIFCCDGGVYITSDEGANFTNISLSGLNINMLWDHMSLPGTPSVVFGGSQDQGIQSTNNAGGTGIFTSTQLKSGDHGQIRVTGSPTTMWSESVGGRMWLFHNLTNQVPTYVLDWTMPGTQKPNGGWLPPTSDYLPSSGTSGEDIFLGGGNLNGGGGSYLMRLSLSGNTFTTSQYSYDFRANSNNGSSGISAIGVSKLSSSIIYVSAEDGTFFYSTNSGSSWTKTANFPGVQGMWLYGASIVASPDSVNKVYIGGSGYSNPAVYVSRDHGQTFTAMSNGLPSTLVNKLAAYRNDSFLFAATEAGPYVYVRAVNHWYSLMDVGAPVVNYRSVEYIASINTVRFGTFARGVFDFVISTGGGTHKVATQVEKDGHFTGSGINIYPNPISSGQFLKIENPGNYRILAVEVFDISGKLVRRETNVREGFNVGQLNPGTYFCNIKLEGILPISRKIIVQ